MPLACRRLSRIPCPDIHSGMTSGRIQAEDLVYWGHRVEYVCWMHEFSIGQRIVDAVLDELARIDPPAVCLCKTRVVIGELHQVVPDYLVSAYGLLSEGTPLAGSELELILAPVVGRCRACGWQGSIDVPLFRCGECQSLGVDMISGKELYLDHLEVIVDE